MEANYRARKELFVIRGNQSKFVIMLKNGNCMQQNGNDEHFCGLKKTWSKYVVDQSVQRTERAEEREGP